MNSMLNIKKIQIYYVLMLHMVVRHFGELRPEQLQLPIVIFLVPSTEWVQKLSRLSSLAVMVNQHIKILATFMDQAILQLLTVQELL